MHINYHKLEERFVETGVPIESGESNLEAVQYRLCQLHIKDFVFLIDDH